MTTLHSGSVRTFDDPDAHHAPFRGGDVEGLVTAPGHFYAELPAQCDSAVADVREIARESGFTQLGRFAAPYRTLFGEAPSAAPRWLLGSEFTSTFADSA